MDKPRIVLCMPRAGAEVNFDAAMAFFNSTYGGDEDPVGDVKLSIPCSTALACTFNCGWATALHMYRQGTCTHFAMQHDDVTPPLGYLSELLPDLEASGADVLSAVVAIKDHKRLSSTAVDDTGDMWHPRRLPFKQIATLPEIFYDEDVGGPLLLNTGCWIVKLGPWCLQLDEHGDTIFRFTTDNRIRWNAAKDKFDVGFIPEDWDASRQFRRLGLKLAATRRLAVGHYGGLNYPSDPAWGNGWDHDRDNAPGTNVRGERASERTNPSRIDQEAITDANPRQHNPAACPV